MYALRPGLLNRNWNQCMRMEIYGSLHSLSRFLPKPGMTIKSETHSKIFNPILVPQTCSVRRHLGGKKTHMVLNHRLVVTMD